MPDTAHYRIIKGECSQFAAFDENFDSGIKQMGLQSSVQFNYDAATRILRCNAGVSVLQQEKPLLKAVCSMYFEFEAETAAGFVREEGLEIPRPLLVHFASLSYGALRGILIDRSGDLSFRLPVLPPVNMGGIVTGPLCISGK